MYAAIPAQISRLRLKVSYANQADLDEACAAQNLKVSETTRAAICLYSITRPPSVLRDCWAVLLFTLQACSRNVNTLEN